MGKIDLIGQKFGRLTVIERMGVKNQKNIWKCRCDCGNYREVPTGHLKSGHTKSCGCYHSDISKNVNTTHSGRKDRLYMVWSGMKKRCYSNKEKAYRNYGGRGIKVCDEWKNDYESFKKWAYNNGYYENAKRGECTLDRINVNGNYCPENCRWVDMKTQSRNKRDNVLITYNNETKVEKDWAEKFGIPYSTVRNRLNNGVEVEDLFRGKSLVSITYQGETKPIVEWSKEKGIAYNTILRRYKRGLTAEQIFDKSRLKNK